MKRLVEKSLAVAALAVGLAMLVWGGHGLASSAQSKTPNPTDEEVGPRMCAPTVGELAEEFGLGLAARKLACLAVAGMGLFVAGGSLLSLMPTRKEKV
jgi:hypothetical protein